MKIKNYFKVILSFMAFALFSFIFAISPTVTAYADMQNAKTAYNEALNSVRMPKKTVNVADSENLEIPLLPSENNPDKYTIRVIDPAGQKHDYLVGGTNTDPYFSLESNKVKVNSLNNGTYDIVYIIEADTGKTYYSNTYSVVVKNVSYSLDFAVQSGNDKGLEILVPANAKSGTQIELPVGYVNKITDDKTEATGETATITVMKNGVEEQVAGATGSAYTISEGKHYLTPTEGTYTIEYTYNKGSNPPSKTFSIVVTDDFEAPALKDLTFTTPTMPTIELGDTEIELPKLTVSDGVNDNVDYNLLSLTITNSNNSAVTKTLTNNNYTFDMTKEFFDVDSYKDLLGNWEITYTIQDAYKREGEANNTKSITVVVKNVKDSTKPSVYMAYNYDVVDNDGVKSVDGNVNTNYAVDLKAKYGYGELVLPAIYAEDLVSDYNDFTFVRYIQNTNTKTIYYIDNKKMEDGKLVDVLPAEEGYNHSGDTNIGKYNSAVQFKFLADVDKDEDTVFETADASKYAGEYTVGYYVVANTTEKQEAYVYSTGTTRYSFTVLSTANSTETVTPTIEINNLKNNSSINSDATINVNVTSKDSENKDTRIKNAVYYYYSTTSENALETDIETAIKAVRDGYIYTGAGSTKTINDYKDHRANLLDDEEFVNYMVHVLGYEGFARVDASEDSANEFNVTLEGFNNDTSVTIAAVAISDSLGYDVDSRTLKINNLDETTAPTALVEDYGNYNTLSFTQGDEVELPTILFTDLNDNGEAGDSSLAMNVSYYIVEKDATIDTLPTYKSPIGKQFSNNRIVGGTIETTKAGTYYVAYTAIDDAGNATILHFTFEVDAKADPILTVGVTGEDINFSGNTVTGDVGSTITFDAALYESNGETDITNATGAAINYTISDGGKGLDFAPTGEDMTFIFNDEGEYTITFTGSYNGNDAIEKVINISISMPKLAWDFDISPKSHAKTEELVTLPELTASQGNKKATVSVKVTDPDGQVVEVKQAYVNEATVWQFTTLSDSKGTYKVIYTAETTDSKIEKTYEIKVGDNVAPTFSMEKENELSQDIVYDGENSIEYQVKLNKTNRTLVIVIDGKEYNTNLTISDKDDAGQTRTLTSWSKLTVELLKNGSVISDYTTDDNNSNYKTYTISATGEYTLKLTIQDSYNNEAVKEIKFDVVTKTNPTENNDTVVGAVLIVISLLILAGVILFFTFSGKKGSGKRFAKKLPKAKTTNTEANAEEKVEEVEETVEAEEEEQIVIEETTPDTEAKEGDVE